MEGVTLGARGGISQSFIRMKSLNRWKAYEEYQGYWITFLKWQLYQVHGSCDNWGCIHSCEAHPVAVGALAVKSAVHDVVS